MASRGPKWQPESLRNLPEQEVPVLYAVAVITDQSAPVKGFLVWEHGQPWGCDTAGYSTSKGRAQPRLLGKTQSPLATAFPGAVCHNEEDPLVITRAYWDSI